MSTKLFTSLKVWYLNSLRAILTKVKFMVLKKVKRFDKKNFRAILGILNYEYI